MGPARIVEIVKPPKLEIWFPKDWHDWGLNTYSCSELLEWLLTKPHPGNEDAFVHLVEEEK